MPPISCGASVGESAAGECWRYDRITEYLDEAEGQITIDEAMRLLSAVSQPSTQWSAVYAMSAGDVHVTMGQQYGHVRTSRVSPAGR